MTESEFYSLKYGVVLSERFHPEEYYVIDCEDEFGNGYMGKEYIVFGATEIEGHHQVRISRSNAQFWKIEGNMK